MNAAEEPVRVLLAFDSFKGSVSAVGACAAAERGLQARFGERVRVASTPMADGGEGSLELLSARRSLVEVAVEAPDAIGRPQRTRFLYDEVERTAYIETAEIIGLPGVSDEPLRATEASSYGVGIVAAEALRRGAERFVLFLGGSATTDGGTGLIRGLGARFLDALGVELELGGGALARLSRVDLDGLVDGAAASTWTFITDVAAPLLGPTGAAYCYAPQKGASSGQVMALESALGHAAEILGAVAGRPLGGDAGFGAAGGMVLAPAACFDTEIVAGGAFLADALGAAEEIADADIVITGEGRFDAQSLDGKVVGTIAALACKQAPAPIVLVVAGDMRAAACLGESSSTADNGIPGVDGVFALAEGAAGLDELQSDAEALIARRSTELVSVCLAAFRSSA